MAENYTYMLADAGRINDFARAIRLAVKPNDVVVDMGCGVGTFAMQAAQAGARRVFGVEIDPIIEVARKIADLNNISIEFLAGDARDINLPEPATLLIFEDYNTGLLDGFGAKLLEVARKNWMAENYRILPQSASLSVAPISSSSVHEINFPLGADITKAYGFDFTPLTKLAPNTVTQFKNLKDVQLLSQPSVVLNHNFIEPLPTYWQAEVEFQIEQQQLLDGVSLWHDLHLNDEITCSNHPSTKALWGHYVFPTPSRWKVEPGNRLRFSLTFQDAMTDGFWKWEYELKKSDDTPVSSFSGNTFAATCVTSASLQEANRNQSFQ